MDIGVRAPNHLGDAVMALPALAALRRIGNVTVYGPSWLGELGVDARPRGAMDAHDAAILLAPSLRAAWEARRCRRRIGLATDFRGWLLTDVVADGVHRADGYAAAARVLGAEVDGPPVLPGPRTPDGHIALLPTTRGGPVRTWAGFRALADALGGRAVLYASPDEDAGVRAWAGPHELRAGGLGDLLGGLRRASAAVGNDSGGAHVARALGVPTVVLYGATVPERTGPPGSVAVQRRPVCRPCGLRRCRYDLECLDHTVPDVLRALDAALG
jgi:ADP-heptose:LPS heptosyltransferase